MYSFLGSIIALIVGYFLYGAFVEKLVRPDAKAKTVAVTKNDGVDYVPMPAWKVFFIQFLNIAGLGPIFGAIMGAKFGVAAYPWIVFGTIFAGAMHDFVSGMISLKNGGESLPESIGRYLGTTTRNVMGIITLVLLILVGVVFVSGPAGLLANISEGANPFFDINFWIIAIFAYYFIVTLVPVDKVIGKVYPVFAIGLILMVVAVFVMLFVHGWELPEFTDPIPAHPDGLPIFPIMFVSIACGAISGFHTTQSPMMARCIKNEKYGRPIFYGSMVLEGVVALVWAAAAIWFFTENGAGEKNAAVIVDSITKNWLGTLGAVLAMVAVVFAPITTGDTALRSARLIVADMFKISQKKLSSRFLVSTAIFAITIATLLVAVNNPKGFDAIWRYFSWCNQLIALFVLWMITVYFVREKRNYYVALIPALFMSSVIASYLFVAPEGLALEPIYGYIVGGAASVISLILFVIWLKKERRS